MMSIASSAGSPSETISYPEVALVRGLVPMRPRQPRCPAPDLGWLISAAEERGFFVHLLVAVPGVACQHAGKERC